MPFKMMMFDAMAMRILFVARMYVAMPDSYTDVPPVVKKQDFLLIALSILAVRTCFKHQFCSEFHFGYAPKRASTENQYWPR
jgi:hypothetical protein